MSLTRVGSIDGFDRTPETGMPQHRRMSFSPIPDKNMDRKNSVANELVFIEVSKKWRIAQVTVAALYCLFAAGPVFGYAALKPILIAEGAFSNLCTEEEVAAGTSPCGQQEIRMNLMFTVAAVSTNVAALPIGTLLDRYGPKLCGILGSLFILVGTLLLAFAVRLPGDAWTAGYFFLALGGPFIYISCFQLSNAFPKYSGTILAMLTGAFDSSSILFLIFRLLYEGTGGYLNTEKLFLIYTVVPVFVFVTEIFVMPSESYRSVTDVVKEAEDEMEASTPPEITPEEQAQFRERRGSRASEIQSLLESSTNAKRAAREEKKNEVSGIWGALHGLPARKQIQTGWFWLMALFTIVQMTRINYFVATIRSQENYLLGSSARGKIVNDFFDIALPLGGVLSVPFIGTILDRTSSAFALAILVLVAVVIGVLGVLPYMWAAILNVILFVLYRPFYYTTVSDYSAKVFGFVTFGKVYGLIICMAGLFNFLQTPFDSLTHGPFHNNPVPVNLMMLGACIVVGIALVSYVAWMTRKLARQRLEEEAEAARDVTMPNGNGTTYGTT